jgi:hypothetical protein
VSGLNISKDKKEYLESLNAISIGEFIDNRYIGKEAKELHIELNISLFDKYAYAVPMPYIGIDEWMLYSRDYLLDTSLEELKSKYEIHWSSFHQEEEMKPPDR